jgi:hypothetical protein
LQSGGQLSVQLNGNHAARDAREAFRKHAQTGPDFDDGGFGREIASSDDAVDAGVIGEEVLTQRFRRQDTRIAQLTRTVGTLALAAAT